MPALDNAAVAVEWRPLCITKVSTNSNAAWRYIVQLQRVLGAGGSREDQCGEFLAADLGHEDSALYLACCRASTSCLGPLTLQQTNQHDEEADLEWLQGAEVSSGQHAPHNTHEVAGDAHDGEQQQGGNDEDEQEHSQSTAARAWAPHQHKQQQKKPPAKRTKQRTIVLRISMMKQAWPDLVERFEGAERAKAEGGWAGLDGHCEYLLHFFYSAA
eukprot:scaffold224431_cov17-Tisochrysis_lutea.AAC.2